MADYEVWIDRVKFEGLRVSGAAKFGYGFGIWDCINGSYCRADDQPPPEDDMELLHYVIEVAKEQRAIRGHAGEVVNDSYKAKYGHEARHAAWQCFWGRWLSLKVTSRLMASATSGRNTSTSLLKNQRC
jgi:hypothetical protein